MYDAGAPLPGPLQARFSASLGADLSQVRVHDGPHSAAAASSLGALAFTAGQDIHFAAGRYDPGSPAGQRLLAHEVAHTVQQGQKVPGHVQTKLPVGAAGDGLEAEADGAAAAMIAGQPAAVSRGQVGARIQRAVGFEFELGDWRSEKQSGARLGKGEKFIRKSKYNVEGEDATETESAVEFVFKPLTTKAEVTQHVGDAATLAKTMAGKGAQFDAGDVGGTAGYKVTPHGTATKMQASPAVSLDHISDLYKQSGPAKGMATGVEKFLASKEAKKYLPKKHTPSPELHGLLVLIIDYLRQGNTSKELSYPKAMVQVMARTSFTKMFHLLPEHAFFADPKSVDRWVDLVMHAAEAQLKGPAETKARQEATAKARMKGKEPPKNVKVPFNLKEEYDKPVFGMELIGMENLPADQEEDQQRYFLRTTRRDWLRNMPQEDLLSKAQDKRFEGMGAYGDATDAREIEPEVDIEALSEGAARKGAEYIRSHTPAEEEGEEGEGTPTQVKEAPIFELRGQSSMFGIEQNLAGPDDWRPKAEELWDIVDRANQGETFAPQGKPEIPEDRDNPAMWEKVPEGTPLGAPHPGRQPPAKKKKSSCWPF